MKPFSEDIWLGQDNTVPPPPPPKSNSHTRMTSRTMAPLPPEPQSQPRARNGTSSTVAAGPGASEGRQPDTRHPLHAHPPSVQTQLTIPSPATLWTSRKETILLSPYTYMHNHPGKDIRTQLISAFNAYLKVPTPALSIITRAIGMLHTSSLLVDDVEDSSQLRRGVPVAHSIFGVPQTLNSANYVYFLALSTVMELGKSEAIQIFTEEMVNLHRGQGMDLWWRDSLICPSEGEYLEMVSNKTGGLFRLAVKLMLVESQWGREYSSQGTSTDSPPTPTTSPSDKKTTILIPLVNTIGLLFQILDDYRNLSSGIYTTNKGLAEDLTEGKFSFPIIHAIRCSTDTSSVPPSSPSTSHPLTASSRLASQDTPHSSQIDDAPVQTNNVLLNILRQKTTDDQVKRYALRYMEEVTHSFAYTRDVLRRLTARALGLIDQMDDVQQVTSSAPEDAEKEEKPSKALRAILEKLNVDAEGDVDGSGDHRMREGRENGKDRGAL